MPKGNLIFKENIKEKIKIRITKFEFLLTIPIFVFFDIIYISKLFTDDFKIKWLYGVILCTFVVYICIMFTLWSYWAPPMEIYENGINYPIFISILLRPKNRYIFIPFEEITGIYLTEKIERNHCQRKNPNTYPGIGFSVKKIKET